MKIGILTHPFALNYGGILQAFALKIIIEQSGHTVIHLNRKENRNHIKLIYDWFRNRIKPLPERIIPSQNFIDNNFILTKPIYSDSQFRTICNKYHFNKIIVGSDQVWNPVFVSTRGWSYFLPLKKNISRMSYAASFGVNKWEYNKEQTKIIKKQLLKFDSITVRESSAVDLLNAIGINSSLVLDPTLLHTANFYNRISSPRTHGDNYVFTYWLGEVNKIKDFLKEYSQSNKQDNIFVSLREYESLCPLPEWISNIKYSNAVITDSFHGLVFALLYHKPFIIFKNESGGWGRITSLLNLCKICYIAGEVITPDYNYVDKVLETHRHNSISRINEFLQL